MKASVPAVAPPTPPETGASRWAKPPVGRFMRASRAFDVDRRAIDKQRAGLCCGQNVAPGRDHMAPGGQHGDDDVGLGDGRAGRIGGDGPARRRIPPQLLDQVESAYPMARFYQIGGHRAAHVAKADKGDHGHAFLPKNWRFGDGPAMRGPKASALNEPARHNQRA